MGGRCRVRRRWRPPSQARGSGVTHNATHGRCGPTAVAAAERRRGPDVAGTARTPKTAFPPSLLAGSGPFCPAPGGDTLNGPPCWDSPRRVYQAEIDADLWRWLDFLRFNVPTRTRSVAGRSTQVVDGECGKTGFRSPGPLEGFVVAIHAVQIHGRSQAKPANNPAPAVMGQTPSWGGRPSVTQQLPAHYPTMRMLRQVGSAGRESTWSPVTARAGQRCRAHRPWTSRGCNSHRFTGATFHKLLAHIGAKP